MQTIDLVVLISKAVDAGHDVTIEHDGMVVHFAPAAPEQKPKREPRNKRTDLDIPKMRALREAGWSYDKIGDEMGCSAQTVANKLKEVES